MKEIITLRWNPNETSAFLQQLERSIEQDRWVEIIPSYSQSKPGAKSAISNGSGFVISSAGSCNKPHQCLQPYKHLDYSALATAEWLRAQSFDLQSCLLFNPLPMHHISGLMPWWRSNQWRCSHIYLDPSLMRNPIALEEYTQPLFKKSINPKIISLVPTQLHRLLSSPVGIRWLKSFAVVWVGGSQISKSLACQARSNGIRLSPCYGATETAAMVSVQTPENFLKGDDGCGSPLKDVEICLDNNGALKIKTPRLAIGYWENNDIEMIVDKNGWWKSGDFAKLTKESAHTKLQIIGRADTAIHSGGETIFPEILEERLKEGALSKDIPIRDVVFLPVDDDEWGQRMIALVSWETLNSSLSTVEILTLENLVKNWLPHERPSNWYLCQELAPNSAGKIERQKWKKWLKKNS